MNLAGIDGLFRYVCFDFDAKDSAGRSAAAGDALTIGRHLDTLNIRYVSCTSGPTGGRHVWVGLAEPTPAETVQDLARAVQTLCPTLDVAPLANPASGCVRPPGSPHRLGGTSRIIAGDIESLMDPSTTASDIRTLTAHVIGSAGVPAAVDTPIERGPLPIDEHGRPYLPGTKRALPAFARAALLDQDTQLGDASSTLWRILLGAVGARWRHGDVAELVDDHPGFEHVRTTRNGSHRIRRPPSGLNGPAGVLRRQWDKAVRHV
jgi:hypothetical protein